MPFENEKTPDGKIEWGKYILPKNNKNKGENKKNNKKGKPTARVGGKKSH